MKRRKYRFENHGNFKEQNGLRNEDIMGMKSHEQLIAHHAIIF